MGKKGRIWKKLMAAGILALLLALRRPIQKAGEKS